MEIFNTASPSLLIVAFFFVAHSYDTIARFCFLFLYTTIRFRDHRGIAHIGEGGDGDEGIPTDKSLSVMLFVWISKCVDLCLRPLRMILSTEDQRSTILSKYKVRCSLVVLFSICFKFDEEP